MIFNKGKTTCALSAQLNIAFMLKAERAQIFLFAKTDFIRFYFEVSLSLQT